MAGGETAGSRKGFEEGDFRLIYSITIYPTLLSNSLVNSILPLNDVSLIPSPVSVESIICTDGKGE